MKQKFTVVRSLSLKQNISEVLSTMLEIGFVGGAAESVGVSDLSFKRIDGENPFEKPIARLTSVAKYVSWNIPESIEKEELTEVFFDYIEKIYKQYRLFKKEKQILLEQRDSCVEGKNRIKLFEAVDIPSASGNAKEIEWQIDMSIEIIENQLIEMKSREDEFFNSKFEKCKCIFNILIRENKKRKFLDNAFENENSYIVSGSLPKDMTDTVCEKLKSIDGAFITKLDTIKLKVS